MGLPQIAWRRWCIRNKCNNDVDKFMQEYPSEDHEAFLTTGRNRFPLELLAECYEPRNGAVGFLTPITDATRQQGKFHHDPTCNLRIFKEPGTNEEYVVAGDPSRTTYGDPACVQVINRHTYEQVAVWHGHVEPAELAYRIAELGYYYNQAEVNCEIEGGGLATVNLLTTHLFYPRVWRWRMMDRAPGAITNTFGFSMNWQRKQAVVAYMIELLGNHMLTLHDEETYEQMRDYVTLPNGEMGPARSSGHDDAVTSLGIAVATIQIPLQSGRVSPDPLQSYSMDLGGNVFRPPAEEVQMHSDINGMPWWEEIDSEY
jgi:hypothetical protein